MPEDITTESQPLPASEAELLAGTEQRINRAMWALGAVGTVLCLVWRGWGWAAGFAIGALLSALNFRWMKSAAQAVADAATTPAPSAGPGLASVSGNAGAAVPAAQEAASEPSAPTRPTGAVWLRFVFRYALIGLVGYAIFKSSFVSLGAFFLGLFLFIAAILAEVAYQVYRAFRGD
jgi:hypothetical protein